MADVERSLPSRYQEESTSVAAKYTCKLITEVHCIRAAVMLGGGGGGVVNYCG